MKQLNASKGELGEKIAVSFLKRHKYRILNTRYSTTIGELDIIVTDEQTLIFVEVKSRTSDRFGQPYEAVGMHKQRKICQVAAQYIKKYRLFGVPVRFDVIEVDLEKNEVTRHIQNAFDSYLKY